MPWGLKRGPRPKLSVVVVFHNMRREARRTLWAFSTAFQQGVSAQDYEVLAMDSNSREPLDGAAIEALQPGFRYQFVPSADPTPVAAMNAGIAAARGEHVACVIDGARIPSPGMLHYLLKALSAFAPAYVMTLGMHLGPKRQNLSMLEGYCQEVEDGLLKRSGWRENGYKLFAISSLAGSSRDGFLGSLAESNCFAAPRGLLDALGGFDPGFRTIGGGFVNLDIHNRLVMHPELTPVMLLGEATFHQFHGGVSTNVPAEERPMQDFRDEYRELRGEEHRVMWRDPVYLGRLPAAARRLMALPAGG